MEALHQQSEDQNLAVICPSVDKDLNALQNFVQSNSLNYTVITNSEDIASQYGLSGIPCTFFINKEGVIMHKEVGFRGEASIQSYVQELLN